MPGQPIANFWAVIPAGGAGTRLWPLSRSSAPKFLRDLTGSGRSLLQGTYDRLAPAVEDRFLVVTGRAHRDAVAAQLPELGERAIIAEPSARDSMAAIGLAAAMLERRDPEAVMGSFAADHVIADAGGVPAERGRRGRGCPRRLAGDDRDRADPSLDGVRLHPPRRTRCPGHAAAYAVHASSWRSRRRRSPRATSRPVELPLERRACSWCVPACCSTCSVRATRSSRRRCARSPPTRPGSTTSGRRCPGSRSTTRSPSRPPTPAGS